MIDDARRVPAGETLAPDLCIVGAGAAGITLALQFARGGAAVLLLESGGRTPEPATQALYEGEVTDERLHAPPHRYRARVFGGSTTIWGGRCTPLDPPDFEPCATMPYSGWPIAPEALAPYWAAANRLCEAGEPHYTAAALAGGAPLVEGFAGESFSADTLERFSCPTDFAARYGHRLEASRAVRVLLHANATELRLDTTGRRLDHLVVRTLAGGHFTVRPRCCVLAVGGLETPRLLLASRGASHPRGVGNDHDVVGRYYMCHLAGTLGTVRFAPQVRVVHGYERSDEGVYCRRRFALRPQVRRQFGLPGFAARLHHPRITDPAHGTGPLSLLFLARRFIPWEYARRLHDGDRPPGAAAWLRHAGNVLRDLPATAAFGAHLLRERRLADRKFPSIVVQPRRRAYSLDVHAEQAPSPASRVGVVEHSRDALGVPRLRIEWRYTPRDVEAVRRALALLAADLARGGVGTLEYDPATVEAELTRYGAYGGHHIGAARMGKDPRHSAVDPDCRVHGVDNLYLAGSAVFPTSGQANPTLTLVALSLRLAAHVRGALAA